MDGKEERHDLPSRFAVFSAKNGKPDVVARFEDDDVWLTQKHLAIIFNTSKQNVSQHIAQIIETGELEASSCVKKFFTVDEKFGRPAKIPIYHYALMSLSLRPNPSLKSTAPAKCASSSPTSTRRSAAICGAERSYEDQSKKGCNLLQRYALQ